MKLADLDFKALAKRRLKAPNALQGIETQRNPSRNPRPNRLKAPNALQGIETQAVKLYAVEAFGLKAPNALQGIETVLYRGGAGSSCGSKGTERPARD